MTDEETFWWCADETGELHTLPTSELREYLADDTIPAHALVWQEGWSEWAPAARVPELRDVFETSAYDLGPLPSRDRQGSTPPPPPLEWYAKRRAVTGIPATRSHGVSELVTGLSALAPARVPADIKPIEHAPPLDHDIRVNEGDRPTTRAPEITLPEEAFPERESFLAHVKARRKQTNTVGPPPLPRRKTR